MFDDEFIELARGVYAENDKQSELNREINLKCKSDLFEEKGTRNIKTYYWRVPTISILGV